MKCLVYIFIIYIVHCLYYIKYNLFSFYHNAYITIRVQTTDCIIFELKNKKKIYFILNMDMKKKNKYPLNRC